MFEQAQQLMELEVLEKPKKAENHYLLAKTMFYADIPSRRSEEAEHFKKIKMHLDRAIILDNDYEAVIGNYMVNTIIIDPIQFGIDNHNSGIDDYDYPNRGVISNLYSYLDHFEIITDRRSSLISQLNSNYPGIDMDRFHKKIFELIEDLAEVATEETRETVRFAEEYINTAPELKEDMAKLLFKIGKAKCKDGNWDDGGEYLELSAELHPVRLDEILKLKEEYENIEEAETE